MNFQGKSWILTINMV